MLAVPGGIESVFAPDAQLRQRHGHARHGGTAVTLVHGRIFQLRLGVGHGAQRRGFGHAPALQNPDAVPVKGADQCLGHGRTTHQRAHARGQLPAAGLGGLCGFESLDQAHPDGGHAQRQRGWLGRHQVQQVFRVQVWAWKHQLDPHHHRAIRNAPAVGVEHGGDGQDHVAAFEAPKVAQTTHQGVQDGGAVRVHHALGAARGARGVAHGHRIVFDVRGVLKALCVGARQQLLVVVKRRRHGGTGEGEHDHAFKLVKVRKLLVQRQQHIVDDQHLVLRVARDPGDLFGRQAQVERVHHAACSRDAEIALQVRVVVPAQRGHAFAFLQAHVLQGLRQLARALVKRAIAVLAQRLVGQARDDFVAGKQSARTFEQVVQRQGHLHHGAADGGLGGGCRRSCGHKGRGLNLTAQIMRPAAHAAL